MSIKDLIIGGVTTVVIGGTAYTVSQADVINNFASDTGMSQQQAEEYVNSVAEEDLVPYDELGASMIEEGQSVLKDAASIDCVNYEYEWETNVSCAEGKVQLETLGNREVALGESYKVLAADTASETDISMTILNIDGLNDALDFAIVAAILNRSDIDEMKNTNSYNKANLTAAVESN